MEIIKKGDKLNKNNIKRKCPHCGCVFTYSPNEIKHYYDKYYVKCPQCNGEVPTFPKAFKIIFWLIGVLLIGLFVFLGLLLSGMI